MKVSFCENLYEVFASCKLSLTDFLYKYGSSDDWHGD